MYPLGVRRQAQDERRGIELTELIPFMLSLSKHVPFSMSRREYLTIVSRIAAAIVLFVMISSCSTLPPPSDAGRLRQTADLIEEVKTFGKSLGIEPTEALRRTSEGGPSLSML